jgi:hypothetical protein
VICIEPETDDGQPYKPWRMRDSPLAIATFEEEAMQSGKMSGHMAEAMVSLLFVAGVSSLIPGCSTLHWPTAWWCIRWRS